MTRKKFIESNGATCRNWTWSWSFVHHKDQVVIFGAWDIHTEKDSSLILSKKWQISRKGRKQPGYTQSKEHILLIEKEGYKLKTFPIIYSGANEGESGIGPSKIGGFIPKLTERTLKKVGDYWYAIK